jgi:hypothetical protein
MKNFLNKEAEKYKNISAEDEKELRTKFKNACQITRSMFDRNAFTRFYRGTDKNPGAGYWEPKKFIASLYDIVMYSFGKISILTSDSRGEGPQPCRPLYAYIFASRRNPGPPPFS